MFVFDEHLFEVYVFVVYHLEVNLYLPSDEDSGAWLDTTKQQCVRISNICSQTSVKCINGP